MSLPGFTAESSIGKALNFAGSYRTPPIADRVRLASDRGKQCDVWVYACPDGTFFNCDRNVGLKLGSCTFAATGKAPCENVVHC